MVNVELKNEFLTICRDKITRDGLEDLLDWLEIESDFFTAPASTKFHGNHAGGLLEHSLNVYRAFQKLRGAFPEVEATDETIAIITLFHDICKANHYKESVRNVKNEATGKWEKVPFYTTDDQFPIGHGEKSVILILKCMDLTEDEIMAIRWHMSAFDSAAKGGDYGLSKAYEMCPVALLLHLADMAASYLMEERNVN